MKSMRIICTYAYKSFRKTSNSQRRRNHNETTAAIVSPHFMGQLGLFSEIAYAKNGRDFAGSYAIIDVVKTQNSMSLTLNLRFFNYSDNPISHAVVSLEDLLLIGDSLGNLGVSILQNMQKQS